MKIISFKENKDKSVLMTVELSEEENQFLVEYAINDILRKFVNDNKTTNKRDSKKSTVAKSKRVTSRSMGKKT